MACDVPGNFIRSSYKGVEFYVESADQSGGRRLAKHEYPNSEDWFVEDLGIKTPTYSTTAYLASDGFSGEVYTSSAELLAVCNEGGAGPLFLPPDIFALVQCETVKRKFEKDKQGWMAFDLEFVGEPAGFGGAPFLVGAGLAARLVADAILSVVSIIVEVSDSYFSAARPSGDVRLAMSDSIRTSLAVLDTAFSGATPQAERAAETPPLLTAAVDALDLFDAASGDAAAAAYASVVEAFTAYAVSGVETTAAPEIVAANLQKNVLLLMEDQPPVGQAIFVGRVAETAYSRAMSAGTAQAGAFSGVIVGMIMAQAYADADYATRRQAQRARGRMVSAINEIVSKLPADNPAVESLITARNQSARAISDKIATLKPMLELEFSQTLTAPYIAWRLYRDASRAEEIATLNGVAHPMFMPTTVEAQAADATRSSYPPRQR